MTLREHWSRFLMTITPLMPMLVLMIVIISLITIVLLLFSKNTWVNKKTFCLICIFDHLSLYDAFCLACASLSLLFIIFFIIRFKKISTIEYIIYLLTSVLFVFNIKTYKKIIVKIPWLVIEASGLFLLNTICEYIKSTYVDVWYVMIYVLVGLLLSLLAIYRFIMAIDEISNQRVFTYEQ